MTEKPYLYMDLPLSTGGKARVNGKIVTVSHDDLRAAVAYELTKIMGRSELMAAFDAAVEQIAAQYEGELARALIERGVNPFVGTPPETMGDLLHPRKSGANSARSPLKRK